jgi:PKD repeat protein
VTWEFVAGGWVNLTGRVGAGLGAYAVFSTAAVTSDSTLLMFGGQGVSTDSNFTWVLTQHPQVTATSSPGVSDVGTPVIFTGVVASGVAPNRPVWKFGDGVSATTLSAVHSYTIPGLFTANLTITDLVGVASTAATFVYVNPAPTVVVSVAPASPAAGSPVGLVASVSGGTAPFTYVWTLGDGNTSLGAVVTHTFANPGTYGLGVRVTDGLGANATANMSVVVGSAPSASVSLTSGTGLLLVIVIVVLAVLVVVLAVLLGLGRRRGPRGPPVRYPGASITTFSTSVAPAPPPTSSGPPPPAE